MTADIVDNWPLVVSVAAVAIVAMLLLSGFLRRDPEIKRTRYGFFVEHDRYDPEEPWPNFPVPAPERTMPQWPDRDKTIEKPPPGAPEAPPEKSR